MGFQHTLLGFTGFYWVFLFCFSLLFFYFASSFLGTSIDLVRFWLMILLDLTGFFLPSFPIFVLRLPSLLWSSWLLSLLCWTSEGLDVIGESIEEGGRVGGWLGGGGGACVVASKSDWMLTPAAESTVFLFSPIKNPSLKQQHTTSSFLFSFPFFFFFSLFFWSVIASQPFRPEGENGVQYLGRRFLIGRSIDEKTIDDQSSLGGGSSSEIDSFPVESWSLVFCFCT